MGDADRRMQREGARDFQGPARTHCVSLSGFVSAAVMMDAIRRFDEAIRRDATIEAIVLDALDIDGFEPGTPARMVRWLLQDGTQIRAGILVSVSPVLLATLRATALLLPRMDVSAAPTRESACAWVVQTLGARHRVTTGIRPARHTPAEAISLVVSARRKASG